VLLSAGGRLVLINSVLDTLPTYTMVAMVLLPLVIKALDVLRRAFLWAAVEHVFGASCLMAWLNVCRTKARGASAWSRTVAYSRSCYTFSITTPSRSGALCLVDDQRAPSLGGLGMRATRRSVVDALLSPSLYRSISSMQLGNGEGVGRLAVYASRICFSTISKAGFGFQAISVTIFRCGLIPY
jgi:hypothetical protein